MNTMQQLALQSYKNDHLDQKLVEEIANWLSRKELKDYIRAILREEKKKDVYVNSAKPLDQKQKNQIEEMFKGKRFFYITDPAMISGVKIVYNDSAFEINIDQILSSLLQYITKYD